MKESLSFNSDNEAIIKKRLFRFRLYFAYGFVVLLFAFLIGRMAHLQWYNFERYHGLAEGNRISIETLPPTRGKIYDRNHILLADNQPVYALSMIREKMENVQAFKIALMNLLDNTNPEKIEEYFDIIELIDLDFKMILTENLSCILRSNLI